MLRASLPPSEDAPRCERTVIGRLAGSGDSASPADA